jgi:hypothetical protein
MAKETAALAAAKTRPVAKPPAAAEPEPGAESGLDAQSGFNAESVFSPGPIAVPAAIDDEIIRFISHDLTKSQPKKDRPEAA